VDKLDTPVDRRTVLTGAAAVAAAGGASLTYASLPAWARPIASAASVRKPDSLPFPHRKAGTPDPALKEIQHIVVLMMENHSFDNLLGMAAAQVPGRKHSDGFRLHNGKPLNSNPKTGSSKVYATRAASPCQVGGEPSQTWNVSHASWNNGLNNGFVNACTDVSMWYWDKHELPFTYSLIEHFPYGQRYFCSVLAQTDPNRRYLFTGTSSGLVETNTGASIVIKASNGTIFDRLNAHHISWLNYTQNTYSGGQLYSSPLIVPEFDTTANIGRLRPMSQFYSDARHGRLKQFTFIDPNYDTTSEENPQDVQVGEQFVASVVEALMHSPQWDKTALFLTYDEHGGYYDHVPPPRAIKPDNIAPIQPTDQPTLVPGAFDRYGFRVPLIVVSPWAKQKYISSIVQDHTSITSFIEHKWNLPAMTFRDANAHPMTDYFHFKKPAFKHPPKLAAAPKLAAGHALCRKAGLTWPTS
jgi:phospholipase C